MLDDIRNHAATPTQEEADWMQTSAFALIMRAVALTTMALFIGISASIAVETPADAPPRVAAVQR